MAAMNKWYAIVDFVEEHGGSLSGEKRDELLSFIREYAEAINADAGSILEASNG